MPEPLSLARQFYERFRAAVDSGNGEEFIDSEIIRAGLKETYWIDYKLRPLDDKKVDPKDFRLMFTKAVSGYANTEGGLLVFGVEEVDEIATQPRPIPLFGEVEAKLRDWIRSATNVAVLGFDAFSFPSKGDSTRGYVVCFIPSGEHKPYRAEHDLKNYYYRAEHSFEIIPPSFLRQLFYPQFHAAYEIRADVECTDKPSCSVLLKVYIKNVGTGPATNCCIQLESNRPCETRRLLLENAIRFCHLDTFTLAQPVTNQRSVTIYLNNPLHPEVEKELFVASTSFNRTAQDYTEDIDVYLHISADNADRQLFRLIFPYESLSQILHPLSRQTAMSFKAEAREYPKPYSP